jgi:hypothetical protein
MLIYLLGTIAAVAVTIFLIVQLGRIGNGIAIGILAAIPFSVLFMIKLRCSIDAYYECGFMSFEDGFTWHLAIGFLIFLVGWIALAAVLRLVTGKPWLERLGKSAAPLVGLWLPVVWEVLPINLIHPPNAPRPGPCPNIPIICHDLPWLDWADCSIGRCHLFFGPATAY